MIERLLAMVKIDFAPAHRQPRLINLVVATVVALVGSLAADAAIVAIATHLFPHTKHYPHFMFADYSKLTVIGVVGACIGWPIVTRISSSPRWVYSRAAVLVTLVLLLPDVYILLQGQPAKAVGALMVMHVAIAVVTYFSMVLLAPVGQRHGRHARR
jgi:hypothetical protein